MTRVPLEEALKRPNVTAAIPTPGGVAITFRTQRPDGFRTYVYEDAEYTAAEILELLAELGFL